MRIHAQQSNIMPSFLLALLACCCCCVSVASAVSTTGSRVLVVVEEASEKEAYSMFFGDLEERGYELSFESPKTESLSLFSHGERDYDHVLLFPPKSKGYGPALTPQLLIQFLNQEGNILALTSTSSTPEQIRELARELDISLSPRDFAVVDHFNYDPVSSPERHDVIFVPRPGIPSSTKNYFSSSPSSGGGGRDQVIAFSGTGHTLGNGPLLAPILTAPRTAYSYDVKEDALFAEDPWSAGSQLQLVSALQARNNARITFSGSAEMFSNKFFEMSVGDGKEKGKKVANRDFAGEVTGWTFKELGVVKVVGVKHWLANETGAVVNPGIYRVKNDVTFSIELSEYKKTHWVPFQPPPSDTLQLEFTMLDPYYRLSLLPTTTTKNSTTFTATFKIPDQHGVFAFKVNYKRPFITYIDEKHSVTVRHFAHNEFVRSWDISGAWVWISGIAVTVVGWVVFCALWLWSMPSSTGGKAKGKKNL